jgi:hypothetical protein
MKYPRIFALHDDTDFEQMCRDICPRCAAGRKLQWDESYKQWMHGWVEPQPGFDRPHTRSAICFATHFRVKHEQT